MGFETSDSSLDHCNFPCPFCTNIFDEKAEVVEHLETCDGTKYLSACSFCSKIFQEKANVIEPDGTEVPRYKHIRISNVPFFVKTLLQP